MSGWALDDNEVNLGVVPTVTPSVPVAKEATTAPSTFWDNPAPQSAPNYWDNPITGKRDVLEQQEKTKPPTKEEYLAKYAKSLDANGNFSSKLDNGRTGTEVDGMNAEAYYDQFIDPDYLGGWKQGNFDGDVVELSRDRAATHYDKKTGAPIWLDNENFADARGESMAQSGLQKLEGIGKFAALAAGMYAGVGAVAGWAAGGAAATGGSAGIGSGTVLGGGTATGKGLIASAMSSPFAAPAISGGVTLAKGGSVGDAIKNAGLAYIGGQIAGAVGGWAAEAGAPTMLAKAAGGAAGAVATGRDPMQALLSGGISTATGYITNEIPGFSALSSTAKSAINSVVASSLRGKTPTAALIAAAQQLAFAEVAKHKS